MSLARVKSWIAEVLTPTDLNAEFNNILNYLNSGAVGLASLAVSGTSAFTGAITGAAATFSGQLIGKGTATNDSAAAGIIGEYLETIVLVGAGSGMGSNVPGAICSISLTAGDWDVWGTADFSCGAGTLLTKIIGCIGPTSAVITTPPAGGFAQLEVNFPASSGQAIAISSQRISVAATTSYYLNVNATFTVSTLTGYGMIAARRRR